MVGWFKITIYTAGWAENKDIICNTIKPVVETLEKTGDIINFFFFQYYGGKKPDRVTLTFYGEDKKVLKEIEKCGNKIEIEKWDPTKQNYRFEDDYPVGIKIFELGSRLALCSIDSKNPIDKSTGPRMPLILTLRHVFLQNLGYNTQQELLMSHFVDPPLIDFFDQFLSIKIK